MIIDSCNLALTATITVTYQLLFAFIAITKQFDTVTDFAGGTNFLLLSLVTLITTAAYTPHQILITTLVGIWAIRLSLFLLYRILQTAKDDRFDKLRASPLRFFGFWVLQMLWVWTVHLSATFVNSPRYSVVSESIGSRLDIAGIVLWVIGFLLETVSDIEKVLFSINGTWRWSRHPNYFGEILLWIGIFLLSLQVQISAGDYIGIVGFLSPVFTAVLLLFVSGLPLQERPNAKRQYESGNWALYKEYLDNTSILVPMPPGLWALLPPWLRTLFFDFSLYKYTPPPP